MLPHQLQLADRVALVTGASAADGIGFATARLLGELGARVAVAGTTDRAHDRAEELNRDGVTALGVVGDLTVEESASEVLARVGRELGEPSILVNNAGMTSLGSPGMEAESGTVSDMSYEAWRKSLTRNLDTAFLVTRAALPGMVRGGWGRIVMVTSVTGPVMAMRGEAAYAAAKAGMVGLARSLSVDYASAGVTANAVAPGWIETGSQTADEATQARRTPAGRSGTPEEVAAVIGFLCTPGAAYVTGQCLTVDGGNAVAEERA